VPDFEGRRINLHLDPQTAQELAWLEKYLRTGPTAAIRQCIAEFVRNHPDAAPVKAERPDR